MAEATKKVVLIVEDERPLAHALELKLQNAGYETVIVQDGKNCLYFLDNNRVDVVLLDLMMPMMDGFQVLEHLQKKPHMPGVIVLSNLSQAEDERRALSMGAKKYFVKSNTPLAQLVKEVENL